MNFDKKELEWRRFLQHEEEVRQWKSFRWFFYLLFPLHFFVAMPMLYSVSPSPFMVSVFWIISILFVAFFVHCLIRVHRT